MNENFAFIVTRRDPKSFCMMKECNCQICEVCQTSLAKKYKKGFIIKNNLTGSWHYACSKKCSDMLVLQNI